jgi:hypothetical protein
MGAFSPIASSGRTSSHDPAPRTHPYPERPPQAAPVNMMDPAILAEIARQVALALHQEREERYYASAVKEEPTKGPRLIRFPGAG